MGINQNQLRKKLMIDKKESGNQYSYSDIAELLNITTQSLYNWNSGAFQLAQRNARILNDWLNDRSN